MIEKIKYAIEKYLKPMEPFKGIAWFLILFLFFDVVWKLFVHEGEDESILLVLGKDMTSSMHGLCLWTAEATHWFVHSLLGYDDFIINGTLIYFPNSLRIDIIWGCTGLKQYFMFFFVMLLYFGPMKKKLWYIPLSLLIIGVINIVRLGIISILVKDGFPEWFIAFNGWYKNRVWDDSTLTYWQYYRDWFDLFHRDVFVWIYYDGVMFFLWLFWEEKINKPFQRLKKELKEKSAEL